MISIWDSEGYDNIIIVFMQHNSYHFGVWEQLQYTRGDSSPEVHDGLVCGQVAFTHGSVQGSRRLTVHCPQLKYNKNTRYMYLTSIIFGPFLTNVYLIQCSEFLPCQKNFSYACMYPQYIANLIEWDTDSTLI